MHQASTAATTGDTGPTPGGAVSWIDADAVDAEVRVVNPVGGRDGWQAIDPGAVFGEGGSPPAEGGGDGVRAWLREYLCGALNRDDRILLILFHFEGLNAREIGAVVDGTEASVAARLDGLNRSLQIAFHDFLEGQSPEG